MMGKPPILLLFLSQAKLGKTETLKIQIEKGTQMLDENGQPIGGAVEAKVMQFTSGTGESMKSFPGGLMFNDLKDLNGNKLPDVGFSPAGSIEMNMSAGGKIVKSFDKPLSTTIEINKEQINPNTQLKYKNGDEIEIYSKSENTGWGKEGTTILTENSKQETGGFLQIKHLSVWSFGSSRGNCEQLVCTQTAPLDSSNHPIFIYVGQTLYSGATGWYFLYYFGQTGTGKPLRYYRIFLAIYWC